VEKVQPEPIYMTASDKNRKGEQIQHKPSDLSQLKTAHFQVQSGVCLVVAHLCHGNREDFHKLFHRNCGNSGAALADLVFCGFSG
jgi:hypothetical protein